MLNLGLFKFQLKTIHPFADGNSSTTRNMNIFYSNRKLDDILSK